MNSRSLIVAISLGLCSAVSGDEGGDALLPKTVAGTWVREQVLPDGTTVSVMKIITESHFSVIQQAEGKARPELFAAHAGRYILRGDVFEEVYEFSSNPMVVGKRARSKLTLEGDKLRQTWMDGEGKARVEDWRRVRGRSD